MKSLPPLGVTLALLAAAAVGVVTTWMLMRHSQTPPVVVVFEGTPGESGRAFHVDPRPASTSTKDHPRSPLPAASLPNSFPRAATPRAVNARGEARVEPLPNVSPEEHSTPPATVISLSRNASVVQQTNQVVFNERVFTEAPPRSSRSSGNVDDALSFALEAADPYAKKGFAVREDFWGGDLAVKSTKAIVHQLFKGNEYWFWMGTDVKNAKISVHVYDHEGNLAEVEAWAKPHFAAARVTPGKTGSYYLIVEVEKSDQERTPWALAYGFR